MCGTAESKAQLKDGTRAALAQDALYVEHHASVLEFLYRRQALRGKRRSCGGRSVDGIGRMAPIKGMRTERKFAHDFADENLFGQGQRLQVGAALQAQVDAQRFGQRRIVKLKLDDLDVHGAQLIADVCGDIRIDGLEQFRADGAGVRAGIRCHDAEFFG